MPDTTVMYGLIDEAGDLIMIPDKDCVLRAWFPERDQVEFLADQGARLVKITLEPITAQAGTAHSQLGP